MLRAFDDTFITEVCKGLDKGNALVSVAVAVQINRGKTVTFKRVNRIPEWYLGQLPLPILLGSPLFRSVRKPEIVGVEIRPKKSEERRVGKSVD